MKCILGINSIYHDSSAAILSDENILAAVEEERFNEVKHGKKYSAYNSRYLPLNAINHCLSVIDKKIENIDAIAYSFNPRLRFRNRIMPSLLKLAKGKLSTLVDETLLFINSLTAPKILLNEGNRLRHFYPYLANSGSPNWRFYYVNHHMAHAASAYYTSDFDKSNIITIDGIGETTCTAFFKGVTGKIENIRNINFPHSLGFFYEEFTKYLGFKRNNDEYKVMGMAAYGKPKYIDKLKKLLNVNSDGGYKVSIDFNNAGFLCNNDIFNTLGPPRLPKSKIEQHHFDIAASLQELLEEITLHMLKWFYKEYPGDNLCAAGGVMLNCMLNERIRQEGPFKNIYIQPAANDAGTALGAALYLYHKNNDAARKISMENSYLGPSYCDEKIELELINNKIKFIKSKDVAKDTAIMLTEQKIVGWFQGRMEWGPRALGNRSIFGDPRSSIMKEKINKIKGREYFRPLSPSILVEHIGEYFDCTLESPYMLFARKVKSEKAHSIPAVVHADGTARFQSVSEDQNSLFYQLIREFRLLTGIPMVLNTSLNYDGRPIVCTIRQALDCFINIGLDTLVIGNYIVSKEAL